MHFLQSTLGDTESNSDDVLVRNNPISATAATDNDDNDYDDDDDDLWIVLPGSHCAANFLGVSWNTSSNVNGSPSSSSSSPSPPTHQ